MFPSVELIEWLCSPHGKSTVDLSLFLARKRPGELRLWAGKPWSVSLVLWITNGRGDSSVSKLQLQDPGSSARISIKKR